MTRLLLALLAVLSGLVAAGQPASARVRVDETSAVAAIATAIGSTQSAAAQAVAPAQPPAAGAVQMASPVRLTPGAAVATVRLRVDRALE